MAVEIVCPTCGAHIPLDPPEPVEAPAPVALTTEVVMPATHDGLADGHEPHEAALAGAAADPFLDALAHGLGQPGPVDDLAEPLAAAPGWPSVLDAEPTPGPSLATSVDDGPAAASEVRERPTRWGTVLLGSYASAMTLACAWLLWEAGRHHPESTTALEPPRAAVVRDEGPARADRSRKDEGPAPIPADRRTSLGKPLQVGDLEVTPLEVLRGPVRLVRDTPEGGRRHREGGDGALKLRLRLRNRSADTTFAPLDEAFVRDPDRGRPDSFVENGRDDRIYPYRLAIRSEWTIVGQPFRDLRPGEAFDTVIVSAPDARVPAGSSPTWRLRLRTGANRDDVIGVDFPADAIRPEDP